jgi:hypothetical protein
MQQGNQRHVCFVSQKCPWSVAFIKELQRTPFVNEVRFINVDPSPTRPQLPGWLKKVPTLVIAGEAEPRTDAEVMNWLSVRRLQEQSSVPRSPPAPGVSAPSQVQGSVPGEPEPFIMSEMGGRGRDFYSFVDQDTSTGGNGGTKIQHNFEFLGGQGLVGGGTATAPVQAGPKKSKREEMFDQQMERYAREREAGMPKVMPRQ